MEIYGLPQPLNGSEEVTIRQLQNGQWALCTMPLSVFVSFISANNSSTAWANNLPTTLPSTSGVVWLDHGVVSVS